MSQPATEQPTQGQPEGGTGPANEPQQGEQQQQSQEPPYSQYLADLPDDVKPLVEGVFKTWDADVNKRFQKLHSEYDPWKPVIDGLQPDDVQGALQVASILEQDPARFLQAFAEAYPDLVKEALKQPETPAPTGSTPEQGLGDLDPDDPVAKKLLALQEQVEKLTGGLSQREQVEQQQAMQAQLDSVLEGLHKEHGQFDDGYIIFQLAQGATPDQAVQAWKQTLTQYGANPGQQQQGEPAPTVVNAGGGLPASGVDPTKLDSEGTQSLVAQMLQQAAESST